MSDQPKHESKHQPAPPAGQKSKQRQLFTAQDAIGRAKRGSEFRDADLLDAPVEDPDDHIPD